MRLARMIRLAVLVLCLPVSVYALGGGDEDVVYQLPMAEAQEIATQWMEQNGFQVFRYTSPFGTNLELTAEKGDEGFRLVLKPQSPLATHARFQPGSNKAEVYIASLKAHLEAYLNNADTRSREPGKPVPAAVRALQSSVVCIYAGNKSGDLQLSGFVLDNQGLIVCTAHDLASGQEVRIATGDNAEINGRVIRIDPQRDLALVRAAIPLEHAVSLKNGRYLLRGGEDLFAVTCPVNGDAGIQSGFLDGPPRRVQGWPLWQVRMHIEHGSSGSPVFDHQGRLTAIVKGRYRGTNSIGFLIPFETLLHFLEKY